MVILGNGSFCDRRFQVSGSRSLDNIEEDEAGASSS